jgi:hypothetical protein|tara:strand:+ start:83 stop:295 length:213 start_codon:yes stop_codon:yes gene_type:complete
MQENSKEEKNFLNTVQLAKRWNKSPRTIMNWRDRGEGPNYYKIGGSVLYDVDEIIELEKESYINNGSCTS